MADAGKLVMQILLEGADTVKAALTQLGNVGQSAFDGLKAGAEAGGKALTEIQQSVKGVHAGMAAVRPATQAASSSLNELGSSARDAANAVQGAFSDFLPSSMLTAPLAIARFVFAEIAKAAELAAAGVRAAFEFLAGVFVGGALEAGLTNLILRFGAVVDAAGRFGNSLRSLVGTIASAAVRVTLLGGALAGLGIGLFAFANSGAQAADRINELASVSGDSVEKVSGLSFALGQLGISTTNLENTFKTLSNAISQTFESLSAKVRADADKTVDNQLRIRAAILSAYEARKRLNEIIGDPGSAKFFAASDLDIAKQQLVVDRSRLELSRAIRQSRQDEANTIGSIQRRIEEQIQSHVNGVTVLRGAYKQVPLTLEQIKLGIITTARAADNAAKGLTGMATLAAKAGDAPPSAMQTWARLADFVSSTKNEVDKVRAATALLGRGNIPVELINALSQGRGHLTEIVALAERLGITLSAADVSGVETFSTAFERLKNSLSSIRDVAGAVIAPAFTEGLELLSTAIEANGQTIRSWASGIRDRVRPIFADFIRLITGQSEKIETEWVRTAAANITALGTAVSQAGTIIGTTFTFIMGLFNGLAQGINSVFGTEVTGGALALVAALGLLTGAFSILVGVIKAAALALMLIYASPVTLALAALIGVIVLLVSHWDQLKATVLDFANNSLNAVIGWANGAITALGSVINWIKDAISWFSKLFTAQQKSAGTGTGGGLSDGMATGGYVRGRGTGTSDSIWARLSNGEFIINAKRVRELGLNFLYALNSGMLPRFAAGGLAASRLPLAAMSGGGSSGPPMYFTINGIQHGPFSPQNDDVLRRLQRASVSGQLSSTGRKPSWYK